MRFAAQTKWRIGCGGVLCLCLWAALSGAQQGQQNVDQATKVSQLTQVLGRPTDRSIALNVLAPNDIEAYVEYGLRPGAYAAKSALVKSKGRTPFELTIDSLKPNAHYYYRLRYRELEKSTYAASKEYDFQTQRSAGSTFVFDVQADSHPERVVRMFDAVLYARTMASVRKDHPDFFISLGDDFSIDEFKDPVNAERVAQVYIDQRPYLGMEGTGAPIFLVNGNHEQAASYLLNGTPNSAAVWAGNSRNHYYPNPAPDRFYTGDPEPVEFIGLLRDYYAFTWGDALFITLDPYWHSKGPVGQLLQQGKGSGNKQGRDLWDITHGEAQYRWLKETLEKSNAKYKFVFAHHVLGTLRGGTDIADLYEWGGRNDKGEWEFDKRRPGWELPIHQLMAKYGVLIFFQGHDHLFVRQQKDGITYQETPTPADPNYANPNDDAYKGGDHYSAAGHLRVTISPEQAKVEYIRSWLAKDETAGHKQDEVAFSYAVKPGAKASGKQ
jgi:Calcineurin-like phosphoesterase